MTALHGLRASTYVVVGAGVAALHVGGIVGAPGVALLALVLAVGFWAGERYRPSGALVGVVLALLLIASATDLLYVSATAFDAFARLLAMLVLVRLFTARAPRELRDAGLLAFFMLVASTTVTFGLGFLFVLVAFVVGGVAMLLLAHDLTEVERAGGDAAAVRALPVPRGIMVLGLAASAATLLVTLVLFFVIPRVGEATLALRGAGRRILVGFTDHVELGTIGQLESDRAVAMRVEVGTEPMAVEMLARLRWRGVALERFDGRVWSTERQRRLALAGRRGSPIEIETPRRRGRPLTQSIALEPIGTVVVFAAPHATRLWIAGGATLLDDNGTLAMPLAGSRLSYTVESALGAEPWGGALSDGEAARYLQLPPMGPRIPRLARELTAGVRGDAQAAGALVGFLSRELRYTLTLERTTELDPLEEFLFVRRAGNCEYFASALAVMLRALGIPARVVNGFQRGEWNPYGGYFLVRMGDAHSWVEAHLDGAGWVTLDPSPRVASEASQASGAVTLWLDALRVRWYRYIVNWSRQDQVMVAQSLRRAAWEWPRVRLDWRPRPTLVLAGALTLALVGWLAWRLTGATATRATAPAMPRFYRRALRALARRGVRPAAAETAREFAARVADAAPATTAPFARVTAAYEAVRFGGVREEDGARAAVDEFLASLSRLRP